MNGLPEESVNKLTDATIKFLGLIAKPLGVGIGLLIDDKIRSWRFQNQVDILIKTQKYVESRGLDVKTIPLKILVPLLDSISLEEDENLKNLWSKMLTNMLTSEENFQKHIFPHILSQISFDDYQELKNLYKAEAMLVDLELELSELKSKETFVQKSKVEGWPDIPFQFPSQEFIELGKRVTELQQSGFNMNNLERDNLERLRLIRQLPPKILIDDAKIGGKEYQPAHGRTYLPEETIEFNVKYDMQDYGYRITDLGRAFLDVCKLDYEEELDN